MSEMSIFIIIAVAVVLFVVYLWMKSSVDYAVSEMASCNQKPYFGDYYKYFYCPDCGDAVYDRTIKNVECCKKCGSEKITKTVGRWELEWKEMPFFSGHTATKFHPIAPHETTKE